jgi:hypothetical protein
MIKWLLSKIFPLSEQDRLLIAKIRDNEKHGVRFVVTERGGWRLEFDDDEARRWYFNKVTNGFKNKGGE